jgi:hypothetical protein
MRKGHFGPRTVMAQESVVEDDELALDGCDGFLFCFSSRGIMIVLGAVFGGAALADPGHASADRAGS